MQAEKLELEGLVLVTPRKFGDERGFFSEVYNAERFAEVGIGLPFVQDNHSRSGPRGTVRGLHFQAPPMAQGKLVRVVRGAVLDVAVDIRKGSPTYGRHAAVELSEENWQQLYVPPGFAHGFCTLAPETEVMYKVTAGYAPETEGGLAWDDESLGIDWPVRGEEALLSDRDLAWPVWDSFESPFVYKG